MMNGERDQNDKFSKSLDMIDIIGSLSSYSIIKLLNDYIHINECHNCNDKKYETLLEFMNTNLGSCIIGICDKFSRNYRNKEICDKDDQQRKNTYFGYLESDSVFLCQIIDCIHCLCFHSQTQHNGHKRRQQLIKQIRDNQLSTNSDSDSVPVSTKNQKNNTINMDSKFTP